MDVLADPGALSKGGPVIDENSHSNRYDSLSRLRRTGDESRGRRMKIAVVGTGYVGLVAGACLAESGNDVVCVDRDDEKVRKLRRGKMPFYEPGLEELVRRNRAEGRLTFTSTLPKAVRAASVIFIAVGTPQGEDGSADVNQVLSRGAATSRDP